jgi:rhodanese-related sulfurtransferase
MTAEPQRNPAEIDVEEFDELLRAGAVAILDVREDWEWRRGRVPGSIHIPLAQLPARVGELPRDRDPAVICEHGNRSLVAAHFLRARGFGGAVSVGGGTVAWLRSGRAIERD